jgi:hypothetical protein
VSPQFNIQEPREKAVPVVRKGLSFATFTLLCSPSLVLLLGKV